MVKSDWWETGKPPFTIHFSLITLKIRVADGTRTRNNQNHNLGLYH
jgi:hypothetical protein